MRLLAGSMWTERGVRCSGRPVFTVGAGMAPGESEELFGSLFTLELTPAAEELLIMAMRGRRGLRGS